MSLTNRLRALEVASQPSAGPARWVPIYPEGNPGNENVYERSRPGWRPTLTSKEEARSRFPGENLNFIVVYHTGNPSGPGR